MAIRVTGVAPERADRAIARVLAGGLDDWRDITAAVTTPLAAEHGRRYERPATSPSAAAEPDARKQNEPLGHG